VTTNRLLNNRHYSNALNLNSLLQQPSSLLLLLKEEISKSSGGKEEKDIKEVLKKRLENFKKRYYELK